ncbi:hypothetical protein AAFF_G00094020 [Aldrovandia affinis]|uniref:Uncharacterized protein n=1 Tax=Aldrovandia affinis TaxID=143900 RepID=A0AAD7T4P6_9TELE|nr:hypothetical protein AAFF_G00094020 [Aldrovandia affinis]
MAVQLLAPPVTVNWLLSKKAIKMFYGPACAAPLQGFTPVKKPEPPASWSPSPAQTPLPSRRNRRVPRAAASPRRHTDSGIRLPVEKALF